MSASSVAAASSAPAPSFAPDESGPEGQPHEPGLDRELQLHTTLRFPSAAESYFRSHFHELEGAHTDYQELLLRLHDDPLQLMSLHDHIMSAVSRSIAPMIQFSKQPAHMMPIATTKQLGEVEEEKKD